MKNNRGHLSFNLGRYESAVDASLSSLREKGIMSRIWAHDHRVWKPHPDEITNRLGWLHTAERMKPELNRIEEFVRQVLDDGYTHALLLGMGGSSLAPEVLRKTFGVKEGYLDLDILDSTDPAAVAFHTKWLNPEQTLFIVSTKSGTTQETLSFFNYFYNWVCDFVGKEKAGNHFIAITDPSSHLTEIAEGYRFRETFINDPAIGGRYSALSHFGLVPAALVGIDIARLLDSALAMSGNCELCNSTAGGSNYGARLGATLGELANMGRDKVTFIISPRMESFGDWVEQLIAESTGKEGKGISPVVGETLSLPDYYGSDRVFVHISVKGDESNREKVKRLEDAGHPVVRIPVRDLYDIGGQFFLWEMATAVAGHILKINPFDQPDVEAAKILTRKAVGVYKETGTLPEYTPKIKDGNIEVYGDFSTGQFDESFRNFMNYSREGTYVAIQAYVQPAEEMDRAIKKLRMKIRDKYMTATTFGYGPRFLHSTGQLHKGDGGNGLFVQVTSETAEDIPIPDEAGEEKSSITFGILKNAQALGDWQALTEAGRKVLRFHLKGHLVEGIQRLEKII